jgi:hypothetical protein
VSAATTVQRLLLCWGVKTFTRLRCTHHAKGSDVLVYDISPTVDEEKSLINICNRNVIRAQLMDCNEDKTTKSIVCLGVDIHIWHIHMYTNFELVVTVCHLHFCWLDRGDDNLAQINIDAK